MRDVVGSGSREVGGAEENESSWRFFFRKRCLEPPITPVGVTSGFRLSVQMLGHPGNLSGSGL